MGNHHDSELENDDTERALSPATVRALVDNHRAFLGFLERRVGDRAVAEDILQEAFAKGLDRLDTVRDQESVIAWFYRVLRNAVIDHYRRRDSARRGLDAVATEMLAAADAPDPSMKSAICACVSRLAGTLKPEYAEALQHIEIEEQTLKDFAETHGISRSNAAVRIFRARQALRRRVVASCGTCAEHGCLDCTCSTPAGTG